MLIVLIFITFEINRLLNAMAIKKLSKTDYLSYLACPEEFWMQYHQPELMPPFSIDAQHKVEQGNIIDRLAKEWFQDQRVLQKMGIDSKKVFFQYQVKSRNCIVKADITVFYDEKECDIYEVKAATKLKEEHLDDIAFQKMVFEAKGYKIRRTFLIHINNKYPFQFPPDLDQFLQIKEVTEDVDAIMEDTFTLSQDALEWIQKEALEPCSTIQVGCGKGLNCAYVKHYHPPLPQSTIFDIANIRAKKKQVLINEGILDIHDVPSDFQLSPNQRLQVDLVQQQQVLIKVSKIKEVIEGFEYPLYFLDYETYSYVFPAQEGLFAYQQMVFQYSLHIIDSADSKVRHIEYLMPTKDTPLEHVVKHMSTHIHPSKGTVLVWNESFEKTQNRIMAEQFPQYADFLLSVNERVYDLRKIFSTGLYLHPKFKGKTSIKKVLPVLCPELSYEDLEIQNGNAAVIKWHHMTDGRMTKKDAEQTYQDLLKYCELDTWAMVLIWEELKKI